MLTLSLPSVSNLVAAEPYLGVSRHPLPLCGFWETLEV